MNKLDKFDKVMKITFVVFITISLLAGVIFIVIQEATPIDEKETELLYQKAEMLSGDFSRLSELTDVVIKPHGNGVKAVFDSENCELQVLYNNEYQVIYKTIVDTRIHTDVIGVILILGTSLVLAAVAWFASMCIIVAIHDWLLPFFKKLKRRCNNE